MVHRQTYRTHFTSVHGTATPETGLTEPITPAVSDITRAIADGFEVIMRDINAMTQEMMKVTKDIGRSAEITSKHMEQAAKVSTATSGLRPPAGVDPEEASVAATFARLMQEDAQNRAAHNSRARRALQAAGIARARDTSGGILYNTEDNTPYGKLNREQLFGYTEDNDPIKNNSVQAYNYRKENSAKRMRSRTASKIAEASSNWASRKGSFIRDPRNPDMWYKGDPGLEFDSEAGHWTLHGIVQSDEQMKERRAISLDGFEQDPEGNWWNKATGARASARQVLKASGWKDVARYQVKQRMSSQAQNVAEAWASGQPIHKALLAALPTETAAALGAYAGGAALAYKGIRTAAAKSQAMYKEGQEISQYTGGSAWEGYKESLREKFGAWKQGFNFFGPGANDYEAIAGSGTQLGLRGERKEEYISTGLKLMGNLKMGSAETTRIMEMVIEAGQSLEGLGESLKKVTVSAREAGLSTKAMRDQFASNYGSLSSGMYAGTGTASLQQASLAQTLVQIAQGRGSGFAQASTSSTYSMVGVMAARNNMSIPKFLSEQAKNPSLMEKTREGVLKDLVAKVGLTESVVKSAMAQFEQQQGVAYPTDRPPNDAEKGVIAAIFEGMGINPFNLGFLLRSSGYTNIPDPSSGDFKAGEVFHFVLLNAFLGQGVGARLGRLAQENSGMKMAGELKSTKGSKTAEVLTKSSASGKHQQFGEKLGNRSAYFLGAGHGTFDTRYQMMMAGERASTGGVSRRGNELYARTKAYSDFMGVSGKSGGIAGGAFAKSTDSTYSMSAIEGLIFDKKAYDKNVKVHIPSLNKTVSVEEAIAKYADKIQSGDAVFVGGSYAGETISGHYGVTSEGGTSGSSASGSKTNVTIKLEVGKELQKMIDAQVQTSTVP